jgi:sulfite reductase alpha subunit-like flavoprotein
MKIPIGCFMRRLGNILSRKYSIAQIDADKNQISLLIKLEKFKVSSNRIVKGLCTHDLAFSPLG